MKINYPGNYRVKEEVESALSAYRSTFPESDFPIDVERFLERCHGVTIVPVAHLESEYPTDTLLASDLSTIYIDLKQYMDPRYESRVRFSLAHELGHIRIHEDLFRSAIGKASYESVEAFNFEVMAGPQERYIEMQAYDFAGGFLVPTESFITKVCEKLAENLDELYDNSVLVGRLLKFVSPNISRFFGVSDGVIEHRIRTSRLTEKLNLDPDETLANQVDKSSLAKSISELISTMKIRAEGI